MQRSRFAKSIDDLQQQHAYRIRRVLQSPQATEVRIDNKNYTSFCSNDYLGLANDTRLRSTVKDAVDKYGVGSGASQLISGYSSVHAELETALAEFLSVEKVLLFSSGFLTNLGVLNALSGRKTLILEDKLNHASLIDGAKYSDGQLKRYHHCDINHAEDIIKNTEHEDIIVASDGVFSMEGTIAPLTELVELKNKHKTLLAIDDAHGIGVMGVSGTGSLEHAGLTIQEVDLLIGTFGKAFGTSGAFVAGNKELIEYLIQTSRTLIYTTAMPTLLTKATLTSLDIIINDDARRQRLHENIAYFRRSCELSGITLQDSITPIQTILIGDNQKALAASENLAKQGILVIAIRPPTVPINKSRLRITLSSEHSHKQIDTLVAALSAMPRSDELT